MLSVYFGAVVGRRDLGYGGSGQRPNETESSNRGALDVGPGHQTSQQLREAIACRSYVDELAHLELSILVS